MAPARRHVLEGVLTADECQELVALQRAGGAVGPRPAHSAATMFELGATHPAWLLPLVSAMHMPVALHPACLSSRRCAAAATDDPPAAEPPANRPPQAAARERVRAAAEAALGAPLLVEFTGLSAWRPGSGMRLHSDAGREYLRQREFAAVLYLNDHPAALFFADGARVEPRAGRLALYAATDEHGVEDVVGGERTTLTLWFTNSPAHDEDAALLRLLAAEPPPPPPPPPSMFAVGAGASCVDLRLCRLACVGLALCVRAGAGALRTLRGLEGAAAEELGLAVCWPAWRAFAGGAAACGAELREPVRELAAPGTLAGALGGRGVPAVLCNLHRWLLDRRKGDGEVCCPQHLTSGLEPAPGCGWLGESVLPVRAAGPEAALWRNLCGAFAAGAARAEREERRWAAARAEWLRVGAVVAEPDAS
jgi:hypothetical protein